MLDQVYVCTTRGLLLWFKDYLSSSQKWPSESQLALVNRSLQDWIIPSLSPSHTTTLNGKTLRWSQDKELVCLAVYSAHLSMPFPVEKVLEATRLAFTDHYAAALAAHQDEESFDWLQSAASHPAFSKTFEGICAGFATVGGGKKESAPRSFKDSIKFAGTAEGSRTVVESSKDEMGTDKKVLEVLAKTSPKPRPYQHKKGKDAKAEKEGKKKKEGRSWDASGAAGTGASGPLDFSSNDGRDTPEASDAAAASLLKGTGFQTDADGSIAAMDLEAAPKSSGSALLGFFSNLTTGKPLVEADLESSITRIKEHLVGKNVAAPVALHLCSSVQKALLGTKLSSLTSIDSVIKKELEKSLSRILTPSSSTNLLHQIDEKRRKQLPYSICFVGVNGVGKSTNLSKICFWLLQNGLSVLIAACDTFRSGAVEQLKVHERNLNALNQDAKSRVQLFDRGYGKDPAGIAKEALLYAKSEGFDVCLIDTAGRMQDNEPLMRALAKLVTTNNPDKIVFVGEALVGNEAVDQLTKFNQALKDFSGVAQPRVIDGMILSKVPLDTADV
ncbi:hypothetical protein HDU91_005002 [Kappamyces sp. JEL0680]|nr:hypothetical protein HDU91_005002 [Kappamyces sp. JEL0680]